VPAKANQTNWYYWRLFADTVLNMLAVMRVVSWWLWSMPTKVTKMNVWWKYGGEDKRVRSAVHRSVFSNWRGNDCWMRWVLSLDLTSARRVGTESISSSIILYRYGPHRRHCGAMSINTALQRARDQLRGILSDRWMYTAGRHDLPTQVNAFRTNVVVLPRFKIIISATSPLPRENTAMKA